MGIFKWRDYIKDKKLFQMQRYSSNKSHNKRQGCSLYALVEALIQEKGLHITIS